MKRILLISILFFLPATASAYSLLQPENFVRLNHASFLLAEEQPAQSPAGQPALDMTQEEKSPDLRFGGKPKILKSRSYLFPIIWDLAPIPALWALALKCSTEKPNINENDCSDKLTVATILGTPFWSIPINAYVQDKNSVSASIFFGKLFILLLAFGINNNGFFPDIPWNRSRPGPRETWSNKP